MQTDDGQVVEPYSISAGLDYPGIGPQHAHLFDVGRVQFMRLRRMTKAMEAGIELSRMEGIIPAIESAHAISVLKKIELMRTMLSSSTFQGAATKTLRHISNGESIDSKFSN